MARPHKRPRTIYHSDPIHEPCFDDHEPIGDQLILAQDPLSIPPLTAGTDSTKPTPFDALPWKSVKLPDLIADGLSFEADGGLLGLEELDGSVWEDIKSINRFPSDLQHPLEPFSPRQSEQALDQDLQPNQDDALKNHSDRLGHTNQPQSELHIPTSAHMLDKEARKKAKKERLAALREQKRAALKNSNSFDNSTANPNKKEQGLQSKADRDLEQVDWAAAAELDGLSDMQQDEEMDRAMTPFDESLLPDWSHLKLENPLQRALYHLSFTKPTPVQAASLPVSLSSPNSPRDLVVIAETGSGKTLAYALPILNALMNSSPPSTLPSDHANSLPITALVLTPTRELCLQVKSHIDLFLKAICSVTVKPPTTDEKPMSRNRTGISTVSVCGGIAIAKQRKQLERSKKLMESGRGGRGCILIATPGRLWDLIQSWDALAEGIRRRLDWLVIDEADKMIERGHFEEIEKVLKLTKRSRQVQGDEDDCWQDDWGEQEKMAVKEDIRTMVFSATMDKNLQINLKKNWRQYARPDEATDPMQDLLERIDFRDEQPELIDLTPQGRMVGGLKECKIECVLKDKDLYLFHFLLRYSGRTIVFLSSISALRRLAPILTLLFPRSAVLTLHSEMQQRSRLKALDRFRATSKSILLSTDVAARGLDIPLVDHVIHYQVPRTVDCYVHRSGRTARAGREGVALALIGPDEVKVWRSLMKSLGKVDQMPSPPIEHSITNQLKELLDLAKKIDTVEHSSSKQAHEVNWVKKTAEMMEIDVEDFDEDFDHTATTAAKRNSKASSHLARQLRAELTEKLSSGIFLRGIVITETKKSNRRFGNCYITDPKLMDRLVKGQSHELIIGVDGDVNAVKELEQISIRKIRRKR